MRTQPTKSNPSIEPRSDSSKHSPEFIHLKSMLLSIEMGCYRALEKKVERFGQKVGASSNQTVKDIYEIITEKLDEARRIENEHGRGCLINLNHPNVKEILAVMPPAEGQGFLVNDIDAAIKYSRLSAAVQD